MNSASQLNTLRIALKKAHGTSSSRVFPVVITVLLVGLVLGACGLSGFNHAKNLSMSPVAVVKKSLVDIASRLQYESITVTQVVPGYSTKTVGYGDVDAINSKSDMTFQVGAEGWTQIRQVGKAMYVQSYNSELQHKTGDWLRINTSVIRHLLNWPPQSVGDPTFVFVDSKWTSMILNQLKSVSVIHLNSDGSNHGDSYYSLILRSFHLSKAKSASNPRLDMTITKSGKARSLTLLWPVVDAAKVGKKGISHNEVSWITVIVSFRSTGALPKSFHLP